MDFALLPPEVNSGRMYAGPGSGPMLAAAAAWDELAAELHSTAAAYGSVVSGLTGGPWLGPAAAAMAAAAAPYLAWLTATATQAEQTASQARAAATAYEAAFAMTVPPPVIAANRSLLASLVATNFLGQNTPAIAATEAHYGEMWAQDAAAMYGYAGHSAAATTLTPFAAPTATTAPAGVAGQAAAVAHAAGVSAGTQAPAIMSAVPQALQGLAAPTAVTSAVAPTSVITAIAATAASADIPAASGALAASTTSASASFTSASYSATGIAFAENTEVLDVAQGIIRGGVTSPVDGLGSAALGALGTGTGPPVRAGVGQTASIGALSVPQSWAVASPATRLAAMALPSTSLGAAPAAVTATSENVFSDMTLAGMAGRALGGTVGLARPDRGRATTSRDRAQPPQRSSAGGGPVTGIAAELRALAHLRDSGVLTDEEFTKLKQRIV
jgi:PPE-repeat protein